MQSTLCKASDWVNEMIGYFQGLIQNFLLGEGGYGACHRRLAVVNFLF